MTTSCDVLVIGGGFYGLCIATHFARKSRQVILCEREPELMRRASYNNQARVHNGYHYPRSILTAFRSRLNAPRFLAEFGRAVDTGVEAYYAVGRRLSKISPEQFVECMRRIGAPIEPAEKPVTRLFDPSYIAGVFRVEEHVFNAALLREIAVERAREAGVEIRLGIEVQNIRPEGAGLRVELASRQGVAVQPVEPAQARHVFCCTYSQLNQPAQSAGAGVIPLKHELAELALIEPPRALANRAITVMDGPFFSCVPFPARGLHSLTHVRYTPHAQWYDTAGSATPAYEVFDSVEKRTAFPAMMRDSARYLPVLSDCRYVDSLWEVKTLLPQSETDDSRPILFRPHFGGIRNYHLIMGGKIDNVFDLMDKIDASTDLEL